MGADRQRHARLDQPGLCLGAWRHPARNCPDVLGLVGPGVKQGGLDDKTWTDHADVRPTILALVGLEDDYSHDGRVVVEQLHHSALPWPIKANPDAYQRLAIAYKQLNAPFGDLSMASIKYSTTKIKNTSPSVYGIYLRKMAGFTERRDALAARIKRVLEGAAFDEDPVNPGVAALLAAEARLLVAQMKVWRPPRAELGARATRVRSGGARCKA